MSSKFTKRWARVLQATAGQRSRCRIGRIGKDACARAGADGTSDSSEQSLDQTRPGTPLNPGKLVK
jgi:hypothetical protein